MVIGIIGKKRHGKDVIGAQLIAHHNFIRYGFADPLKRGAMEMFGFSNEQMWGDLKEVVDPRWGITPREVLQILGTELLQFDIHKYTDNLKHVGRNIWAHRFKVWYEEQQSKNVVITDVRFQHEVDVIRSLGGYIWKVERPYIDRGDSHPSEVEMEKITDIDHHILNEGTIIELNNKIDIIFNSIKQPQIHV